MIYNGDCLEVMRFSLRPRWGWYQTIWATRQVFFVGFIGFTFYKPIWKE